MKESVLQQTWKKSTKTLNILLTRGIPDRYDNFFISTAAITYSGQVMTHNNIAAAAAAARDSAVGVASWCMALRHMVTMWTSMNETRKMSVSCKNK